MGFTYAWKKRRQAIVEDYLTKTGRTTFVPEEFTAWLSGQPEHVAYPWFFDKD